MRTATLILIVRRAAFFLLWTLEPRYPGLTVTFNRSYVCQAGLSPHVLGKDIAVPRGRWTARPTRHAGATCGVSLRVRAADWRDGAADC